MGEGGRGRAREVEWRESVWYGRTNGLGWAGARAVADGVVASCPELTHLDMRLEGGGG
jgi:hypothetical protein